MNRWNVLATAQSMQLSRLPSLLNRFGRFRHSPFRGVLLGYVESHEAFFEALRQAGEEKPGALAPLARLVPIDRTFPFAPEDLLDKLQEAVRPYVERIGGGSFHVRMERRGHKGELHSTPTEQTLDRFIVAVAAEHGQTPRVVFDDPDFVVVVETLQDECGVGLISRALRERFPFVRAD